MAHKDRILGKSIAKRRKMIHVKPTATQNHEISVAL